MLQSTEEKGHCVLMSGCECWIFFFDMQKLIHYCRTSLAARNIKAVHSQRGNRKWRNSRELRLERDYYNRQDARLMMAIF